MKKITIFILCQLVCCTLLSAQGRIIDDPDFTAFKEGDYVLNNRIDQYVGTWEWKNGNEVFTLIIQKKKKLLWEFPTITCYSDYAIVYHKYIKNGNIIEDLTKNQNAHISKILDIYKYAYLKGRGAKDCLALSYFNPNETTTNRAELKFVSGKTDQLHWKVYNRGSDFPTKAENFKLPVDVILEKVSDSGSGSGGTVGNPVDPPDGRPIRPPGQTPQEPI